MPRRGFGRGLADSVGRRRTFGPAPESGFGPAPDPAPTLFWNAVDATVWTTILRATPATDGVGIGFLDEATAPDTDGVGQVTAGAKPTRETASPGGAIFDGGDTLVAATNTGVTASNGWEMMVGMKPTSDAAFQVAAFFGSVTALQGVSLVLNFTGVARQLSVNYSGGRRWDVDGALSSGAWVLVNARYEAGQTFDVGTDVWLDGVLQTGVATVAAATPNISDTPIELGAVGGSLNYIGEMAFVALTRGALTAPQRAAWFAWGADRLGL